jgi:hypothetical protein
MSHLVDSLERAYRALGFEEAAGGDEVFRQLVLARVIEPVSKLDSLRVLDEAGVVQVVGPGPFARDPREPDSRGSLRLGQAAWSAGPETNVR